MPLVLCFPLSFAQPHSQAVSQLVKQLLLEDTVYFRHRLKIVIPVDEDGLMGGWLAAPGTNAPMDGWLVDWLKVSGALRGRKVKSAKDEMENSLDFLQLQLFVARLLGLLFQKTASD